MKLNNLSGLDQDLKRGIEYNRKHGGVSETLKKIKKRPENPGGVSHFSGSMGDNDKFWELSEYFKKYQCCWMCNKKNGRIIDGKYCSEECKNNANIRSNNARNI